MIKPSGKDIPLVQAWNQLAGDYLQALENDYHRHRLSVVESLIPRDLLEPNRVLLDFGCGDGHLVQSFLARGCDIRGIDVCPEMIAAAKGRLVASRLPEGRVQLGGVESLSSIPTASLDAILAFNVLAYVTDEEEGRFYKEAFRLLRAGGYLAVTHSNQLFDLFSLNAYTIQFFRNHFVLDDAHRRQLPALLTHSTEPDRPSYNIRENPIAYRFKLSRLGFDEVRQEFINYHEAPPLLLQERHYPDTLNIEAENRWKLMFMCSTFGSVSVRRP